MKFFDDRAARVLLTTVLFGLGLLFLWMAWRTIIAFVFAILFAYLMEAPICAMQTRLRLSRGFAIAAAYLGLLVLVAALLALAAPRVMRDTATFVHQLPSLTENLKTGQIAYQVGGMRGWSIETQQRLQSFIVSHRDEILGISSAFLSRAAGLAKNSWWLLLVPILAVFFLKDGPTMGHELIDSVRGTRNRRAVSFAANEMSEMLGHYIRAQLLLAVLAMVVLTLALWIFRMPYAFVLGPAAGALEFIPVVGPIIGGALVLGVGFLASYTHLLWVLLFLLLWRGIQDYVNAPKIMGGKLEMHPLAVLFGVLAGAEVAGVIGVFLSVPVLAALRILWRTWRMLKSSPAEIAADAGVGIEQFSQRS